MSCYISKKRRPHPKPLSPYPLKAEEALRLFMQVDPKKAGKNRDYQTDTLPPIRTATHC